MVLKILTALRALYSAVRRSFGSLYIGQFRLPDEGQSGPVEGCAPPCLSVVEIRWWSCVAYSILSFAGRDQEMVVALPSLDSPERERRRCAGVGRICKIRIFVD